MTQPRGGLGRGLGALIPRGNDGLLEVDVDRIVPNPRQPRQHLDETQITELADSIRAHGILQPLVLTRTAEGGYQLIAGERRWRAARLAGLRSVPAVVKEASPREQLEWALVENLQRQDLGPLEAAAAYRQLVDEHGLTQEAVAERVGKSRVAISNTLRLLGLPAVARQALAGGAISEGHARAILSCPDLASQQELLEQLLERGLSVRQSEAWARQARESPYSDVRAPSRAAAPPLDPDLTRVEDDFRAALGTRVVLRRGSRGGRLVIYFFSDDELQGLYQAICGEALAQ